MSYDCIKNILICEHFTDGYQIQFRWNIGQIAKLCETLLLDLPLFLIYFIKASLSEWNLLSAFDPLFNVIEKIHKEQWAAIAQCSGTSPDVKPGSWSGSLAYACFPRGNSSRHWEKHANSTQSLVWESNLGPFCCEARVSTIQMDGICIVLFTESSWL